MDDLNLLVTQGRPPYPLRLGGAARVTHRLLQALSLRPEVNVLWIGQLHSMNQLRTLYPAEKDRRGLGIRSIVPTRTGAIFDLGYRSVATVEFWREFRALLDADKPSLVWANLENACELLDESKKRDVPGLLYVMDAEYPQLDVRRAVEAGTKVACLSRFLASHVRATTGCNAEVLYPIVDSAQYINPGDRCSDRSYVLMVNPYPQKGLRTFLAFSQLLPHIRFVLQESWPLPEAGIAWLRQRLATIPNVTFRRAVADMAPVYANARLLVVPSIWQEGFGMVSVEAQSAGVPVIASRRGGLPESVGSGGILIDDYENPREWARTIEALLNDAMCYQRLVAATSIAPRRPDFSEKSIVDGFLRIARTCRHSG